MDPLLLDQWRRLGAVASAPGRVTVWDEVRDWAADDPGHLHANTTTVVCLEGVVRVRRPPDGILDLHPGDILVVGPAVWHDHAPTRRGSAWFAQGFLMTWADWSIVAGGRTWYGRCPLEPSRGLAEALLTAPPCQAVPGAAAWLSAVVREDITPIDHTLAAAMPMARMMWQRLRSGISAEELVRASGMSRATALRTFSSWFGMPPGKAIARCRLALAGRLLAQGRGVEETARFCGFASAGTLTRAWRREHGVPPRTWRRGRHR